MASAVGMRLKVTAIERSGQREAASGGVSLTVGGEMAGAAIDRWTAGRLVRVTASLREPAVNFDPGVPDRRDQLADRGTRYAGSVKSAALVEVLERGSFAGEAAARARRAIRRVVRESVGRWSERSAAIVIAILIGDRAGLGDEVERRLQEAGTYHVIAISGGNIAILAGLLLGLARLAGGRTRWSFLATSVALLGYAFLVGGSPSVVRATIMAVVYLVGEALDWRTNGWNVMAVAAGLVMVAAPLSIRDPGFPLTFGATLGILIGMARFAEHLPRAWWAKVPAGLFLASLSAEIALLPVSASAFSRVTFAGLLLNFLAIPLMSLAQIAGLAALVLGAIDPRLAAAAGWAAHFGAWGLVESARFVDAAPWTAFRVPPPPTWIVLTYYGALAARLAPSLPSTARRASLVRPLRRFAPVVAALAVLWILFSPAGRIRGAIPSGRLSVTFLDVGQADSAIVRLPDARALLIDTGGSYLGTFDVGGRVILPALWALDVFRLDALVITHGHPDHVGGARSIVRDFRVAEVWEGVSVPCDEALGALRSQAESRGVPWRRVVAGDRIVLGDVTIDVLHPPEPDWERQKVRNDDSIVLDIRYGNGSFLMAGDIGVEVERDVLARLRPAAVRVLKVPHHGSAGSSSPLFLSAAAPAVAVFTIGRSRPTAALQSILRRYDEAGIDVYRTDRDGAVTITTDGKGLKVETVQIR